MSGTYETYDDVRDRLDEIVDAVNAEGVTLDDALALYEEAVKLGLLACDLSEEDVEDALAAEEAEDGAEVASVQETESVQENEPAEAAEAAQAHELTEEAEGSESPSALSAEA